MGRPVNKVPDVTIKFYTCRQILIVATTLRQGTLRPGLHAQHYCAYIVYFGLISHNYVFYCHKRSLVILTFFNKIFAVISKTFLDNSDSATVSVLSHSGPARTLRVDFFSATSLFHKRFPTPFPRFFSADRQLVR